MALEYTIRLELEETPRPLVDLAGDIYTDWDIDKLAETLRGMLDEGER